MVAIKSTEEIRQCPCGIQTDQAIVWNFSGKETTQPLCRSCQADLNITQ
jgi:hypothetical protein